MRRLAGRYALMYREARAARMTGSVDRDNGLHSDAAIVNGDRERMVEALLRCGAVARQEQARITEVVDPAKLKHF